MNKINYKEKKATHSCVLLIMLISIVSSSCRKLVESPIPTSAVSETNVYSTDATAIAVLDGIYISMNNNGQPFQGNNSIALFAGLSADEFTLYSGFSATSKQYKYYTNNLAQAGTQLYGMDHWSPLYNFIFRCNAAIEGLNKSETLTSAVKQQLLGEAKFMRAFFYFYLVNLFGDVPLAVTTDPAVTNSLARSPKIAVYDQIARDLKEAEELLSVNYLSGTLLSTSSERIRPTKWAATALLARAYLYMNDYTNAEDRSTAVINNATLFGPISAIQLNSVFLTNSKEAIWQLQPTAINFNTQEAQTLVLSSPTNGPNNFNSPVYLSNALLNSFEANDLRAKPKNWIDTITVLGVKYYFPYKYKINSSPGVTSASGMSEYFMVLRLGEQYLIRAEARARLGSNLTGATDDLDKIRGRAGISLIATTNPGIGQSALIDKIVHERQVELFSEWGHRWLDLKRTNNVDAVMGVVTPQKSNGTVTWQPYQALYPILLADIQKNPNLVQNSGY